MGTNPYLDKLARRQHGQKAEKRAAKRIGGRLQPASGALVHAKGDIKCREFLVESKASNRGVQSIRLDWLRKITGESLPIGRLPVLLLQYVDSNGQLEKDGGWAVIPEWLFREAFGVEGITKPCQK